MRPSGRKLDELRSVSIETNITKHAEGSCLIKCGETHVICTATVDEKVPPFMRNSGLGWVKGEVIHLNQLVVSGSRVPHMGWSRVEVSGLDNPVFDFVRGKREFYFSHSYAFSVKDNQKVVAITSDYDVPIVAAIVSENIFATQFHPEKSQLNGEKLLLGFLKWRP